MKKDAIPLIGFEATLIHIEIRTIDTIPMPILAFGLGIFPIR
jgi:hypothetical protein